MEDEQFSSTRIASILKQMDDGENIDKLCVEHGISSNTLYRWKARYGGTESLLNRLDELEKENYLLKGKLADIAIQRNAKSTGDLDHIYRILAANIPGTAITILDRNERYLLAEGDFLETMGYVKETMPGKKISEIITPENYNGYYKDVIQRVFAGESILVERQTLSKHYSLMKVVPLRDGEGEIFAIMFALIDVTPLKLAQLELSKINHDLETKVLERTKQLEEANRQLESFSYSISHDLRAPLRSISGFASILKEDYAGTVQNDDFDRLINKVIEGSLRMETLINDLLNFSRYERKEMLKAPVDMHKLVHEVLDELKAEENPDRKINISISALEPAEADANLIRQVWINLLSNALKYSRKKEQTTIEINSARTEDNMLCYSVRDNGAGFDMNFAGKLFGVFQRLHTLAEFEGTGVGLALAKSIVQRHGGKIWAESEVNKGTCFYFTLPIL